MAEKQRVDKKVYNYRSALEQPIWIQKLSEKISLSNAIKLSTIGWSLILYVLYLWLMSRVEKVIPIPLIFWATLGFLPIWSLGIILSDLKIEQQPVGKFLKDYVRFYWKYGRKRKRLYLNDGLLYFKPGKRMALNNEVEDIVENLILKKDGSVFALYEIEPQVLNPVDEVKKEASKNLVVDWLEEIK